MLFYNKYVNNFENIMTTSTLSRPDIKVSTNNNDLNNLSPTIINGRAFQSNFAEQINGKTSIELNGEDFILLGVNSPNPKFQNNMPKGTQNIVAYKKPHEEKGAQEVNEMGGSVLATSILALLPMGHLLEQFKHIMEMANKTQEENGTKVRFTYTQNINPNAAIKPNEAFLPTSPFRIEPPKAPSLWDRVRKEAAELKEAKKKKKAKGLGSY